MTEPVDEARKAPMPPARASTRAPSRRGKKPVTAYVPKDVHKRLRLLGIELDKSTQEMITEALDDYFKRYGAQR